MKQEKLAIAAVPVQEWGDVYDREEALKGEPYSRSWICRFSRRTGRTAGEAASAAGRKRAEAGRRGCGKFRKPVFMRMT